jgi:hypothetical protein
MMMVVVVVALMMRLATGLDGRDYLFSSLSVCADRLWGPPSLLTSAYRGFFLLGLRGRSLELPIHLYLLPTPSKSFPPCTIHIIVTWCLSAVE